MRKTIYKRILFLEKLFNKIENKSNQQDSLKELNIHKNKMNKGRY